MDYKPYVIVAPNGLKYIGLETDEDGAWRHCLGWPDKNEVEEKKRDGWYCAQAELTWKRPPTS